MTAARPSGRAKVVPDAIGVCACARQPRKREAAAQGAGSPEVRPVGHLRTTCAAGAGHADCKRNARYRQRGSSA